MDQQSAQVVLAAFGALVTAMGAMGLYVRELVRVNGELRAEI